MSEINLCQLSAGVSQELTRISVDQRWQAESSTAPDRAVLLGPDGMELIMRLVTWGASAGRLMVSPSWGKLWEHVSFDGQKQNLTISVAGTRPPTEIAKQINRRLLPRFHPLYQAAVESKMVYDENRARARSLAQQLATVLDGSVHGCEQDQFGAFEAWGTQIAVEGRVVVYSEEQVDLTLRRVSPSQAEHLLRLLQPTCAD